jgi:hypothetical protein
MADFVVGTNGDFTLANGALSYTADVGTQAKQNVLFRLQTDTLDYSPDREIGVGLHQFAGRPNTRKTGEAIQRTVFQNLTKDGVIPPTTLKVEVVPLSAHDIGVYVFHTPPASGPFTPVTVAVTLNLISGEISLITG